MRILCGTDFSVYANHAALAAAEVAKRFQGMLTLTHVLDPSRYSKPSKDLLDHLRYTRQNKLTLRAAIQFRFPRGGALRPHERGLRAVSGAHCQNPVEALYEWGCPSNVCIPPTYRGKQNG